GNTKGIWRPSKHSMMISLGYYFDQVSRERMVRQISARVGLIADSTPTVAKAFAHDTLWINPAHPVYHELNISWKVDDRAVPDSNVPYFDLETAALGPEEHKITVTVVDLTEFVRDPGTRADVLTATRSWTVPSAAMARVRSDIKVEAPF